MRRFIPRSPARRCPPALHIALALFALLALPGVPRAQPTAPGTTYELLGERLQRRFEMMDFGGGRLAALVTDARLPIVAYARDEHQPLAAGSLIQILTAAAALDWLGPEFQFKTELRMTGNRAGRTLNGDLIVIGDGDPTIGSVHRRPPPKRKRPGFLLLRGAARLVPNEAAACELFDDWTAQLRQRGIRRVEGRVIGDAARFDGEGAAPGWPMRQRGSARLPTISALNFNDNCLDFFWHASNRIGMLADFSLFPRLPGYNHVSNNVRVQMVSPAERRYERVEVGNLIAAIGSLSPASVAHDRAAIASPPEFFAVALQRRMEARGIAFGGEPAAAGNLSPGELSPAGELLATHLSPPLPEILADMLRHDAALHAECILKTVGLAESQAETGGSFAAGVRAVQTMLRRQRVGGSPPTLLDGSGRSTLNRVSPAHLVRTMQAMLTGPQGQVFERLLPRAGDAGVLEGHFQGRGDAAAAEPVDAKPPVWAIPAAGEGYQALAGWAEARGGRRFLFAFMVEGSALPATVLRDNLDRLVLEITRLPTQP
ncbi:MAG TPA: D-alanyl-D-alanine carboxypeptidase/D-alanyl-D-alanine-endopeptidase [Candidatus Sumerlaeota bacterium]|nr:D-alanyl-D-alanine carboxypeptidase/D-alanyl-D-alanine-endopeptidase [Candidatus Sumerlaeota bacterium]